MEPTTPTKYIHLAQILKAQKPNTAAHIYKSKEEINKIPQTVETQKSTPTLKAIGIDPIPVEET